MYEFDFTKARALERDLFRFLDRRSRIGGLSAAAELVWNLEPISRGRVERRRQLEIVTGANSDPVQSNRCSLVRAGEGTPIQKSLQRRALLGTPHAVKDFRDSHRVVVEGRV